MSEITKKRPSRTAVGTTLFRSIANKEYNNEKFGSDYLAELFLPFLGGVKFIV